MHRLIGDDPVGYGLLGNTVANFDDDVELLLLAAGPVEQERSVVDDIWRKAAARPGGKAR